MNLPRWLRRHPIIHAGRNTVAGVGSLVIARAFHLPELYWACITSFVVLQAGWGTTFTASWQRLAGTALGATIGALLATYVGTTLVVFAVGIFLIGLICAALHLDGSFRLANITLSIVLLITRTESHWLIAMHRFLEVTIGIVVALALTAVWNEVDEAKGSDTVATAAVRK